MRFLYNSDLAAELTFSYAPKLPTCVARLIPALCQLYPHTPMHTNMPLHVDDLRQYKRIVRPIEPPLFRLWKMLCHLTESQGMHHQSQHT